MVDAWLPGYERHEYRGLGGKPYQYTHNPKGCLHTTEGGSIAGAMSAYAPYPPHLIYDWRNRRGVQHVRLDRAAYSAMDGNDDDFMVQVELVGFARETRGWSEQALRNIAQDVIAPLERAFGIPRRVIGGGFKDERSGITLASASSPIRLSAAGLRDFSGWLGHQHLPAPDNHWDPGALDVTRILSFVSGAKQQQEDDVPNHMRDIGITNYHGTDVAAQAVLNAIEQRVDEISGKVDDLVNGTNWKGQDVPNEVIGQWTEKRVAELDDKFVQAQADTNAKIAELDSKLDSILAALTTETEA
jgi:hypothetical protein